MSDIRCLELSDMCRKISEKISAFRNNDALRNYDNLNQIKEDVRQVGEEASKLLESFKNRESETAIDLTIAYNKVHNDLRELLREIPKSRLSNRP